MQKHILAADDEQNIRRLIEVNLTRAGYRVTLAADGREALQLFRDDRPDLVVLDWMMPYLDGHAVLQTLKRDPKSATVPVVMLTAKAQDRDVVEGLQSGADFYLTKPFNPRELVIWVNRVLSAEAEEPGDGRIRL